MKKAFVFGMAALVTTMSLSLTVHAAPGAKPAREALVEYTKQVKAAAFGKRMTSKGLDAQQLKVAQDNIINELALPSGKNNALSMALKADPAKSAQRLDSLATIVAAKKMAAEISKNDANEGQSIDAAATASAKLMANSSLTGARKTAKDLNAAELTETTAALSKLETLPEAILTRFSKAERDSYTQIIERHDQIVESGKRGTSEEAFVDAIMEVKGVDKAKAMEVVKKLKECV
ncbi:hypothetical protein ACES2I_00820 [Bdellovibrio bacteriovorus]|uniref:hypothetical protein n=1 Tax=Bdellovibrio bacteriovorus TaxID=959 RepID=UPI0035A59303